MHIVGGSSNDICVFWTDTVFRKLKTEQSGETLKISDGIVPFIYGVIGLIEVTKDKALFVQIPNGYSGTISVNSVSNKIVASDCNFNGDIEITTNTGAITLTDFSADRITLLAPHGVITCQRVKTDKSAFMKTVTGFIECGLCSDTEYFFDCKSAHGSCSVPYSGNAVSSKVFAAQSNTGSIHVYYQRD